MKHMPWIDGVEPVFGQVTAVPLCEHENIFQTPQLGNAFFPERAGYIPGNVATEPVYIGFDEPELHSGNHTVFHNRITIIQLARVRPVLGYGGFTRAVLYKK